MASKRKAIGKKQRFEIFKRDFFVCQYCGSTPPTVVLQIDHIHPVSKGGDNDNDNLLTACEDCNQGKGATELSSSPETLSQKQELLAEKEEQLREYKKLLSKKKRRQTAEVRAIAEIFDEIGHLPESDKNTIRTQFLPRLMPDDIEEAMRIAVSKYGYNPNRTWKYFCGICWNKIRRNEEGRHA